MADTAAHTEISVGLDLSGVHQGFTELGPIIQTGLVNASGTAATAATANFNKVSQAADGITTAVKGTTQAFNEFGPVISKINPSNPLKKVEEEVKGSADRMTRQVQAFASQIQRSTAEIEAGGRGTSNYYEVRAKQLGIYNEAVKENIEALKRSEAAQLAANAQLGNMGLTAKQTAAALRGVPAQLTDIVVSLQGGQAPLTVLLQQGGQLKDMFGGIGGAAKAMGGYLVGLINPYTVLAAAVGAVGYAYYKGATQTDEFTKAILISGNAAGVTLSQLTTMATAVSKATGGVGASAETLAIMAQSGKVAGDNLQYFATVAQKLENTVGLPVKKTVEAMADLAKEPLKASERLNEQYNYLTASVYRQIDALEKQGKTQEAADLAQKAFFTSMETRADQYKNQLGFFERGWLAVKEAIAGAGNAVLKIGVPDTLQQQLEAVRSQIRIAQGQDKNRMPMPWDQSLADLRLIEASLQEQVRLGQKTASAAVEQKAATESTAAWAKELVKYEDDHVKLARQKTELTTAYRRELANATGDVARQAQITKEYNQALSQIGKKTGNSAIATEIEQITQAEKLKQEAYKQTSVVLAASLAQGRTTQLAFLVDSKNLALAEVDSQIEAAEKKAKVMRGSKDQQKELAKLEGELALLRAKRGTVEKEQQEKINKLLNDRAELTKNMMREEADKGNADFEAARRAAIEYVNAQVEAQRQLQIGLKSAAELQQVEAANLGETNEVRAKAVALMQIEIARRNAINNIPNATSAEDADALTAQINRTAKLAEENVNFGFQIERNKTIIGSIESTAHSVWTNVLQGGQNAFKKIGDTIKSAVLDLLYQITIKKWVLSISASVLDFLGLSPAGGAGGGGGLLGTAKSAYDIYSTGKGAYSIYSGAQTAYNTGVGMYNGLGYSSSSAAAQAASAAGANTTGASGATGASSALGGASVATIVGIAAIAAFGIWAVTRPSVPGIRNGGAYGTDANGNVILTNGELVGNPNPSQGSQVQDTNGAPISSGVTTDLMGGRILGKNGEDLVQAMGQSFVQNLSASFKRFGSKAAFTDFTGGVASSNDGTGVVYAGGKVNGQAIGVSSGTDPRAQRGNLTDAQGIEAYGRDLGKLALQGLQAAHLEGPIGKYLSGLGDIASMTDAAADATIKTVAAYESWWDAIKDTPFDALKNLSVEAAVALSGANGGLQKFIDAYSNYWQMFATESEQMSAQTANLSQHFADLGITMPPLSENTRQWYRDLINYLMAQDLSIQSNADALNSALNLAGGVDQLATAFDRVASGRKSWQDRLDLMTGTKTQDQIDMENALAGTTDATTQALIRQYYAQKALRELADQVSARLRKIAEDNQSWTDRIAILSGTKTQDEIDWRNALAAAQDDTTRELINEYYTRKGLLTFQQQARQALEDEKQARLKAASDAKGVLDRAIAREKEYWQTQVDQAQKAVDSLKSVFDTLQTNIDDLYKSVASTATMSASDGKAFIQMALEVARAGGNLPDGTKLTEAIGSVRTGIEQTQFRTKQEADAARLVLAGQLSELKDRTKDQLTAQEAALEYAKSQIDRLDQIAKTAQDQLDALNGIDVGIHSVAEALALFNAAVTGSPAPTTPGSSGGGSTPGSSSGSNPGSGMLYYGPGGLKVDPRIAQAPYEQGAYRRHAANPFYATWPVASIPYHVDEIPWGTPEQGGGYMQGYGLGILRHMARKGHWTQQDIASAIGWSLQQVQDAFDTQYPEQAPVRFAVGTNYIPYDNYPALLHKGEAVVPAAYNPAAGGSASNDELLSALRELNAKMQEISNASQRTADSSERSARAWDGEQGMPLLVKTV